MHRHELSNAQFARLAPFLPDARHRGKAGRPWLSHHAIVNGILWILRTGAQWHTLPAEYPPYQTCHRRFQRWVRDGTLERVLEALARDLKERGGLDLAECFIDGTFVVAKRVHIGLSTGRHRCLPVEQGGIVSVTRAQQVVNHP